MRKLKTQEELIKENSGYSMADEFTRANIGIIIKAAQRDALNCAWEQFIEAYEALVNEGYSNDLNVITPIHKAISNVKNLLPK